MKKLWELNRKQKSERGRINERSSNHRCKGRIAISFLSTLFFNSNTERTQLWVRVEIENVKFSLAIFDRSVVTYRKNNNQTQVLV